MNFEYNNVVCSVAHKLNKDCIEIYIYKEKLSKFILYILVVTLFLTSILHKTY